MIESFPKLSTGRILANPIIVLYMWSCVVFGWNGTCGPETRSTAELQLSSCRRLYQSIDRFSNGTQACGSLHVAAIFSMHARTVTCKIPKEWEHDIKAKTTEASQKALALGLSHFPFIYSLNRQIKRPGTGRVSSIDLLLIPDRPDLRPCSSA